MTNSERETTITYDSEEKLVRIFSARAVDQSKLRRAGIEPDHGSLKTGLFYKMPLIRLSWRIKRIDGRGKRVLPSSHPFLRDKLTKNGLSDSGQGLPS